MAGALLDSQDRAVVLSPPSPAGKAASSGAAPGDRPASGDGRGKQVVRSYDEIDSGDELMDADGEEEEEEEEEDGDEWEEDAEMNHGAHASADFEEEEEEEEYTEKTLADLEPCDLYAALELAPGIGPFKRLSISRVQAAFHKLAVRYYNLLEGSYSESCEVLFSRVVLAFLVLKNEETRTVYDTGGFQALKESEKYAEHSLFDTEPYARFEAFFNGVEAQDRDYLLLNGADGNFSDEEDNPNKIPLGQIVEEADGTRKFGTFGEGLVKAAQAGLTAASEQERVPVLRREGGEGGEGGAASNPFAISAQPRSVRLDAEEDDAEEEEEEATQELLEEEEADLFASAKKAAEERLRSFEDNHRAMVLKSKLLQEEAQRDREDKEKLMKLTKVKNSFTGLFPSPLAGGGSSSSSSAAGPGLVFPPAPSSGAVGGGLFAQRRTATAQEPAAPSSKPQMDLSALGLGGSSSSSFSAAAGKPMFGGAAAGGLFGGGGANDSFLAKMKEDLQQGIKKEKQQFWENQRERRLIQQKGRLLEREQDVAKTVAKGRKTPASMKKSPKAPKRTGGKKTAKPAAKKSPGRNKADAKQKSPRAATSPMTKMGRKKQGMQTRAAMKKRAGAVKKN